MSLSRRAIGALSRRLGRPELLAAFSPAALRDQRETLALTAVLAGTLGSEQSFVDVGANRGQVLGDAVRIAPRGRHLAFEPIPELAAEVRASFPGVECRQLALAAQPGKAQFCHFTALDGWSGLRRNPHVSDERGRPQFIEVEVSTLDAQIGELQPSVVKIDVEGAELSVLEGARLLLSEVRPLVLFEHVADAAELYGASSAQLYDLLDELSYEIFTVTGEGPFERAGFGAASGVVNWLARPLRR